MLNFEWGDMPLLTSGLWSSRKLSDSDLGVGRRAPSVRLGFSLAAEQSDSDLGGGSQAPPGL